MKKRLCKFITLVLACSIVLTVTVFPTVAEEETAELSFIEERVAEWRENPSSELWIPLMPKEADVTYLVQSDTPGIYAFETNLLIDGVRVRAISFHSARKYPGPGCVPTTRFLVQKGLNPFDLSSDNLSAIGYHDRLQHSYQFSYENTVTYSWESITGKPLAGFYQNHPAAYTLYSNSNRSSGNGDINLPLQTYELLVALSDKTLVSILFFVQGTTTEFKYSNASFEQLEEFLSIGFTTTGDADLNGTVNAIDALAILKHAVGAASLTDELAFLLCDIDDNGLLEAEDALYCLQRAVGKQTF